LSTTDEVRQLILDGAGDDLPADRLTDDYPLLENQVIDSMGIFELVNGLEQRYGIEILDEELVPENFGTIAAIARFVEDKRATLRS
jgi:acyl carrier protein